MKYIRCKHRGIMLFPSIVRHDRMAEWVGGEILSAGNVTEDGRCVGSSSTLGNLAPLPDDERILAGQGLPRTAESLSDFQREVAEWAQATFPQQTPHSKMRHLEKEIGELREDLSDIEEMADCFILLLNLCEMAGGDLLEAAKSKMEKNRRRKWGEPDADGVCHHIPQEDEAVR